MSDPLAHARALSQRIAAGWQREDIEAQLIRLHARRRARARQRAVVLAAAGVAAIAGGLAIARQPSGAVIHAPEIAVEEPLRTAPARVVVQTPAPELAAPSGVLALGDGSVVTPLAAESRLLARRVSETEVVVVLTGGSARFDVPERKDRRFRADVGALALETRGAAFRVGVTRRAIEVVAERGAVSARLGGERHVVGAGETRAFAISARGSEPIAPAGPEPSSNPLDPASPADEAAPASTWRDAAARGDYAGAQRTLARELPLDSMEDLLLAGDVARLSGHSADAVAHLVRAVERHTGDPRAPLAAFTLGRVHLEDLGAPRDAALAFAQARALAPRGPLAEDALAREVEAWSRAGELATARARALDYVAHYAHGRRVYAVRRFGGLERP